MKVVLARPRGFCSGVKRAIAILDNIVTQTNDPVYVYHEIVHNTQVVESFRQRGVVFVETLEEVPPNSIILFSAHGVSPLLRDEANKRGLTCVDATCPLVDKLHQQVRNYVLQGYHVILVGHPGHDEVIGTLGEVPNECITLVSKASDVDRLQFSPEQKLACVVQTTFLAAEANAIIELIAAKASCFTYSDQLGVCRVTQQRQDAIRNYSDPCDMVLVIGSRNSSNSRRLLEVALDCGFEAYLVDKPEDIDLDWFVEKEDIFLTVGASAPEETVQDCVAVLVKHFNATVVEQ